MSKKPEEEIEEKLRELELAMNESTDASLPATIDKSARLATSSAHTSLAKLNKAEEARSIKADMYLLAGFTALLLGIFLLFSHLTVHAGASPFWPGFGAGNGCGVLILLLLVGLGFFFYDYKNKIAWILIIGSLAALVFFVFSSMQLFLAPMSLLGFVFLFLPWVIGGALLAKGIKMQSLIRDTQKSPEK